MNIINQREPHYGDPIVNHERIAAMWSAYLKTPVTAHDAAICMILVKVSRLAHTPGHTDSLLDISGYAEIAAQCGDSRG